MHRAQWFEGKNKGQPERYYHWPFESHEDQDFIEACIPSRLVDAVPTSLERAERYKKVIGAQGSMGPSWGALTRRRNPGRIYLADGNHRAYAEIEMGWPCVPVMLPLRDYLEWQEKYADA